MVEAVADSQKNGEDEEEDWGDWGDAAEGSDGEGGTIIDTSGAAGFQPSSDIIVSLGNEKGFRCIESSEVSKQVVRRIQELQDLYEMDLDSLITIARHYNWN